MYTNPKSWIVDETFPIHKTVYLNERPNEVFIMNSKRLGGFNFKDNSNWFYKFADYDKFEDPHHNKC